jgi:hypothetical protein
MKEVYWEPIPFTAYRIRGFVRNIAKVKNPFSFSIKKCLKSF